MSDTAGYVGFHAVEGSIDVGQHRYAKRNSGVLQCVFCGCSYSKVPLNNRKCTFDPARRIVAMFHDAFRFKGPFIDERDFQAKVDEVLELVRIRARMESP